MPQSICGYNTLMELWWFKDTLEVYLLKSERNNRWWMRDRGEWHPLPPVSSLPAHPWIPNSIMSIQTIIPLSVSLFLKSPVLFRLLLAINNQIRSYSQERHMSKFVRGNFCMPISYDCYIIKGNFWLFCIVRNISTDWYPPSIMIPNKKPLIPLFAFNLS